MKRYHIEQYLNFETVNFYSLRAEEEQLTETDLFFTRIMNNPQYHEDISKIKYWMEKIGKEARTEERYFRPEQKAYAIPIVSGCQLRLYCYRVNAQILIFGNGGIKSSKKVQDSPDAYPHFLLMNQIVPEFIQALKSGLITLKGKELQGNLKLTFRQ